MNILTPMVVGDSVFTSTHRNNSFFFDVAKTGDTFSAAESWRHKAHGYMSSPIIIDGHAYLKLGNRRVICIDLESGKETWTSEPLSEYFSMVAQGHTMLALGAEGELHLIAANPEEFELLDSREISEQETWGYLAVVGDELFVRELGAISVFKWASSAAAAAEPTESSRSAPRARDTTGGRARVGASRPTSLSSPRSQPRGLSWE